MSEQHVEPPANTPEAPRRPGGADSDDRDGAPGAESRPTEHGGRPGPDPTRFGDWEKNGRCIDF